MTANITMNSELEQLKNQIDKCRICRTVPIGPPLKHEPRPVIRVSKTARICIAGQAPGTRVHTTGIPFNDPSGDRLRDWLGINKEIFYDESQIAIVPMGFCFPGLDEKGSDLPPRPECRKTWHDKVFRELTALELIIPIGKYAHSYHLGTSWNLPVSETIQNWWELSKKTDQNLPRFLPLPHPSWRNSGWLKKNPWFESEILPILKSEVAGILS